MTEARRIRTFRSSTLGNLARCLLVVLWLSGAARAVQTPLAASPAPADPSFEQQIRPLLQRRCWECHGSEEQNGGLRLDLKSLALGGGDSGPAITPGQPAASELFQRITSQDNDLRMPPPPHDRLSDDETALLGEWIRRGAAWPETDADREAARDPRRDHWAFQSLRVSPPPEGSELSPRCRNPIDAFLSAQLNPQGLELGPEASRPVLIRRLALDLTGLPPDPEDVQRFLQDDRPDAYERLADRLLGDPRYGERWAQHWLDVVRYADTHGFEVNTPRENAWPYRDYVIRCFNQDRPYDRFVREQLAGDLLQADAATGFLVASAVLLPGQIGQDEASMRQARQDELDEVIQGVSATLLGLTLGCARCHDHKFDPLTARDYYAMQAFFAGLRYGDRPIRDAAFARRSQEAATLAPRIAELERALAELEPRAFAGRTVLLDERPSPQVQHLQPANGPGANPAGAARGYRDDPGDQQRVGNLSGGAYTWWDNAPGRDVIAYRPELEGRFRLWVSWGVHGSGVHTRDARYVIDHDGDLQTREDQAELARVDQYYPAGVSEGETEQQPLWSGLLDLGVRQWRPADVLLVRGGDTGTGVTADVVLWQDVPDATGDAPSGEQPRLRPPLNFRRNTERFPPVEARWVRFTTLETVEDNRHEPCLDELEIYGVDDPQRNLALAAEGAAASSSGNYSETGRHQLPHIHDGKYGNDWSWISNQRGGGWVQIVLPDPRRIDRVVWGRDRDGQFADRLPVRYRIDVSLDGQTWRQVASHEDRPPLGSPYDEAAAWRDGPEDPSSPDPRSWARELDQLRQRRRELTTPRLAYAGVFGEPDPTHLLRRGDPEQRVAELQPAIPAVFREAASVDEQVAADRSPAPSEEQARRLRLADWIASAENPLTARVLVNRLWAHHFGQGLVATPSDFGVNGGRPTHPELLDWLAAELIRHEWSLKRIQHLIVTSAAYRQVQRHDPRGAAVDRDNRWLWTFRGRRLEAEAIRDAMLCVSGELNLQAGGPGFDLFASRGGLNGFPPLETFGAEGLRRMIYAHKVRMERAPVFGAFDCPDAGQATPVRSQSTTAIQALNLFNSPFVLDRAAAFAARVRRECGDASAGAWTRRAFELALGRPPVPEEAAAAEEVVRRQGLETLCRVLFNSNEFLFLP